MSQTTMEDPVMAKVKGILLAGSGVNGVRHCVKVFRSMDTNQDHTLSPQEFAQGIAALEVPLNQAELKHLFLAFDSNKDGKISLDEFLSKMLASMNSRRSNAVKKVFAALCQRFDVRDGQIPAKKLIDAFDASAHPNVLVGGATAADIRNEFVGAFALDANNDGLVSQEEFLSFFTGLSATVPNDGMFEAIMLRCFHADDATAPRLDSTGRVWPEGDPLEMNPKILADSYSSSLHGQTLHKGYNTESGFKSLYNKPVKPNPSLKPDYVTTMKRDFQPPSGAQLKNASLNDTKGLPSPTGNPAIDKVRAKILERAGPDGFVGLQRAFRTMDKGRDQAISKEELDWGMKRLRIELSPAQLETVFKYCDRNSDHGVTVGEFCRAVRGPITSQARIDILLEAFQRLDRSGDGVISLQEIAPRYDCSRHPDVLAGIKTKDEVVHDFIADWDQNRDGKILLEEWMDYYGNISCTIDDDQYFELMIRNAWHISGGHGTAQNTTCRRVLAIFEDDRQRVLEIQNDIGLKRDDVDEMKRRLMAQGYTGIKEIKLHM